MKWISLLLISMHFTLGCASGRFLVDASPQGTDIFVKKAGSDKFENLGKTPMVSSISEIQKRLGNADTIVVEARRSGYISKALVVTDVDSNSDVRINFELPSIEKFLSGTDKNLTDTQKRIMSNIAEDRILKINEIVDRLFEAQRLTQVGRLEDAGKKLDALEKEFPNISAIYEIRGGIAYMKKDFIQALDDYRKASRNNPENLEIINMKNFLEAKVSGGRSLSGESP